MCFRLFCDLTTAATTKATFATQPTLLQRHLLYFCIVYLSNGLMGYQAKADLCLLWPFYLKFHPKPPNKATSKRKFQRNARIFPETTIPPHFLSEATFPYHIRKTYRISNHSDLKQHYGLLHSYSALKIYNVSSIFYFLLSGTLSSKLCITVRNFQINPVFLSETFFACFHTLAEKAK